MSRGFFRTLFIGMMLLVLPLQSFAAVSAMAYCAPSNHNQIELAVDGCPEHPSESGTSPHKMACCNGVVAMTTSPNITLLPPARAAVRFARNADTLPSVILECPKRPPRTRHA